MATRRILAVVALAGGLLAAFWTSRKPSSSQQMAFLLNHVAVSVHGVVLDRTRLTGIGWRVADVGQPAWDWQHFKPGAAPDVSDAVAVTLPEGATQLEVACRFELMAGAAPVRSLVRVPVPAARDGVVPVDVEACGEVVR